MSTKPHVCALAVSDIHLSHKAPVARSEEACWYTAMAKPLRQVKAALKKHGLKRALCAGDVFDKWNPPPSLINFALNELPDMDAIPGQHDLPCHEYAKAFQSAYGVLSNVGKIHDLAPGKDHTHGGVRVWAFPWGYDPTPCPIAQDELTLNIAVAHHYIWTGAHGYTGADDKDTTAAFKKRLRGYHCAIFGDNHKGFIANAGKCVVGNHGGMMRRKTDERDYRPGYLLIYSDGSLRRVPYDTEGEVLAAPESKVAAAEQTEAKIGAFVRELEAGGAADLNFSDAVDIYFRKNTVRKEVRDIILKALD